MLCTYTASGAWPLQSASDVDSLHLPPAHGGREGENYYPCSKPRDPERLRGSKLGGESAAPAAHPALPPLDHASLRNK